MFLKNYKNIKWIWRPILLFCEKNIDKIYYNDFDYINHFFYKYYFNNNDIETRKQNIDYLHSNLELETLDKFKNNYFTYPLFFKNKLSRNNIRNILIDNKIYCPIYWPINFDNKNKCNYYITNHILCIPIDQRYNLDNMKYIVNIINQNL